MPELTQAQARVLIFCANFPYWHLLTELDLIKLLDPDDVLTVPSLIERKLLRYWDIGAVTITSAGQVLAEEFAEWITANR